MCGSDPLQHAIPLAKARAGPQGQLGRIYPFILQDTHMAKQQVSKRALQEG